MARMCVIVIHNIRQMQRAGSLNREVLFMLAYQLTILPLPDFELERFVNMARHRQGPLAQVPMPPIAAVLNSGSRPQSMRFWNRNRWGNRDHSARRTPCHCARIR